MKKLLMILVVFGVLLLGCTSVLVTPNDSRPKELMVIKNLIPTEAVKPLPTLSPIAEIPTEVSALLPTFPPNPEISTEIPSPLSAWDLQRTNTRLIMEEYGFVEEYYLTEEYWSTLYNRIASYGVAERIAALEYHGNDYSMYDGTYSMTPAHFYTQIEYLMENDYHFVTIHELKGFLEGWLDLPERSIILTTDSGYTSKTSFQSIVSQFSELEDLYGYRPHMQSYIWTKGMTEIESVQCRNDACWDSFREAKESGFFTFGTHSETHPRFELKSKEFLKDDLQISINKIYDNIEISVYAITWPHESCPQNFEVLDVVGIQIGFGGLSKPEKDAFVYKNDDMHLCLPRLFPPNGGGYSSRPYGFTLEDILYSQEN